MGKIQKKSEKLLRESLILSVTPLLLSHTQTHLDARRIYIAKLKEYLITREIEILGLIAAGKSNYEIAGMLKVKEKTVKNCINRIYSKLNIKSRYEAISYMLHRT